MNSRSAHSTPRKIKEEITEDMRVRSFYMKQLKIFPKIQNISVVTDLDLSFNNFVDFSGMVYMPSLTALNISNTKISSFIGAIEQPSLVQISAHKTPLSSYSLFNIMCLIVFGPQLQLINQTRITQSDVKQMRKYRETLLPYLLKGWVAVSISPNIIIYEIKTQKRKRLYAKAEPEKDYIPKADPKKVKKIPMSSPRRKFHHDLQEELQNQEGKEAKNQEKNDDETSMKRDNNEIQKVSKQDKQKDNPEKIIYENTEVEVNMDEKENFDMIQKQQIKDGLQISTPIDDDNVFQPPKNDVISEMETPISSPSHNQIELCIGTPKSHQFGLNETPKRSISPISTTPKRSASPMNYTPNRSSSPMTKSPKRSTSPSVSRSNTKQGKENQDINIVSCNKCSTNKEVSNIPLHRTKSLTHSKIPTSTKMSKIPKSSKIPTHMRSSSKSENVNNSNTELSNNELTKAKSLNKKIFSTPKSTISSPLQKNHDDINDIQISSIKKTNKSPMRNSSIPIKRGNSTLSSKKQTIPSGKKSVSTKPSLQIVSTLEFSQLYNGPLEKISSPLRVDENNDLNSILPDPVPVKLSIEDTYQPDFIPGSPLVSSPPYRSCLKKSMQMMSSSSPLPSPDEFEKHQKREIAWPERKTPKRVVIQFQEDDKSDGSFDVTDLGLPSFANV